MNSERANSERVNRKRGFSALIVSGVLTASLWAHPALADDKLATAAQQQNFALVRELLAHREQSKIDVNGTLGDGTTALHWAARSGNLEAVRSLLQAGANPNATTRLGGITPLALASMNGDSAIVEALLKAGARVDSLTDTRVTPLMMAASSGSADAIRLLLDHGAQINAREQVHGHTPLMFAAAKNRANAIRVLLKRGADWKITTQVESLGSLRFDDDGNPIRERGTSPRPQSSDGDGKSATSTESASADATLSSARATTSRGAGEGAVGAERIRAGRGTQATNLTETGLNALAAQAARRASAKILGGHTALTLAAREGHRDAVAALLENGVDVNQPGAGDLATPLVIAICNGHYDLAKQLLDHGANPNLASVDGLGALYAVIDTQWAPVGWAPNPITDQEQTGYLALMEQLLKRGADVNARLTHKLWFRPTHHDECWIGSAGATPFWRAAQATDLAAMRLLVAHGADPKIVTIDGDNALMVASGLGWNGNFSRQAPSKAIDVVKYCLELGIDPKPQDVQGYTALAGAAYRGDNDLINLLVSKGVRLDTRNTRGWSVTDMANGPSLRSSVPLAHPYTVALLQKLGAPPLTPLDGEEILGIIRKRPATQDKTSADSSANSNSDTSNKRDPAVGTVAAPTSEAKRSGDTTGTRQNASAEIPLPLTSDSGAEGGATATGDKVSVIKFQEKGQEKLKKEELVEFEKMTWPELKRAIHEQGKTTVLIFNGGTEQRGPQGITAAHTFIARALGKEIALKLGNAILAPVLPYSPNNANPDLPGTIGITPAVYAAINQEVAEQMIVNGFKNVVLMGDHGGGQKELEEVAKRLDAKYSSQGIRVVYCDDAYRKVDVDFNKWLVENGYPVGSHAGIKDTSEMLYLGGDQGWVRKELLPIAVGTSPRRREEGANGGTAPTQKPEKRESNGIVGDARRSSPEIGKRISDMKVEYAVRQIRTLLAPAK